MSLAELDRNASTDDAAEDQDRTVPEPAAGSAEETVAPIYAEIVAELGDPTTPPA